MGYLLYFFEQCSLYVSRKTTNAKMAGKTIREIVIAKIRNGNSKNSSSVGYRVTRAK
jgi:hypothetical protein